MRNKGRTRRGTKKRERKKEREKKRKEQRRRPGEVGMVNLYFKVKMNPLNKNKRHKRKEGRAGRNRILRNSGATKLWIAC